jgi:hypothetical protein
MSARIDDAGMDTGDSFSMAAIRGGVVLRYFGYPFAKSIRVAGRFRPAVREPLRARSPLVHGAAGAQRDAHLHE